MKKNVLIISNDYPPNNVPGAQRAYNLAKYINKNKFDVKIITCENMDLPLGVNHNFDNKLDGVELIYVKSLIGNASSRIQTSVKNSNSLLSKIKHIVFKLGQNLFFTGKGFFWLPKVLLFLNKNKDLIKNTDVLFSTSPGITNHQIANIIKRRNKNINWIADFRDFHYVENFEKETYIKSIFHKKIEFSIVKNANHLTFVTDTMLNKYKSFYPLFNDKMSSVYNGFDIENSKLLPKLNNQMCFFYAGSFYNGLRSPFPLFQLLDKAIHQKILIPKDFKIQIAGNIDNDLKILLKQYISSSQIEYLGNLSREKVKEYMRNSSFLWLIVANKKSHYYTIPIKLYEYIAAKRPILNFAPSKSESSLIVNKYKLGYNFNTSDFSVDDNYFLFSEIILKFKNKDFNYFIVDKELEMFNWQNQIKKIEYFFDIDNIKI